LFELDSVTVALTNALSRAFRNKQGNYLLVLTSDYERIDFVLVEKTLPIAGDGPNLGEKQVTVLPHVLTINRRKPGRRELRILRRFTYTESDPLYQFEKLKSTYAIVCRNFESVAEKQEQAGREPENSPPIYWWE
jgi:hypothetical protein